MLYDVPERHTYETRKIAMAAEETLGKKRAVVARFFFPREEGLTASEKLAETKKLSETELNDLYNGIVNETFTY